MIKQAAMIGAVVVTLGLSACGGDGGCSQEELTKKAQEVGTKMSELATSDPAKMQELQKKMADIAAEQAKKADAGAACKAYDDLLASLNK